MKKEKFFNHLWAVCKDSLLTEVTSLSFSFSFSFSFSLLLLYQLLHLFQSIIVDKQKIGSVWKGTQINGRC